jgi:hypothetical protein
MGKPILLVLAVQVEVLVVVVALMDPVNFVLHMLLALQVLFVSFILGTPVVSLQQERLTNDELLH